MENSNKVFCSNIIRNENPAVNKLDELLNIVPAKPLPVNRAISDCDFWPKTGKHYVPKKKSRLKVKTVRNIRHIFEQDTYTYLFNDLEKQNNVLLKKIRDGTSKEESTKKLAKSMFYSEQPISRKAWEMLVHLNPQQYTYPKQCVLWNGRNIEVNGSRGGKCRFLYNRDLSANLKSLPIPTVKKRILKNKNDIYMRKSLLKNSLNIKFKPGPLGKKIFLDDSHQKYHVGDIKLVELPKLGLDIQPVYGMTLGSTISSFLDNLRDDRGIISQKWAEFAVSVLGTVSKSRPVQISKGCVTFDLNYKCDQHRMLMRLDHDKICPAAKPQNMVDFPLSYWPKNESLDVITSEIKCIIDDMIDSIEISLDQNSFYSVDEVATRIKDDVIININVNQLPKDKQKRKYCELDRLAVTVIRVPENTSKDVNKSCNKLHCSLGCICDSLECAINFKQHCGRIECMFECKCDFSKYSNMKSLGSECSEILPGLLNLNNERHLKLSKEEQKFHQTVIVSGEKSILLKTQKRDWKSSKKYAEFYNNMPLKPENKIPKTLSVVCFKLDSANIEPWCMVHNLYKCFCKGKFTETSSPAIVPDSNNKNDIRPLIKDDKLCENEIDHEISRDEAKRQTRQLRKSYVPVYDLHCNPQSVIVDNENDHINTCARINTYNGRKFKDEYYLNTNKKILEMEENDSNLHKKLMALMHDNRKSNEQPIQVNNCQSSTDIQLSHNKDDSVAINKPSKSPDLLKLIYLDNEEGLNLDSIHKENKSKLVAWLEYSYQQYKRQLDQGFVKKCLDPPRKGKLVLYTWDLILSRYRERKNLFLVTKKRPFRIFIVIHNNHPLFKLCINIDDIKFDDLPEYPLTVKNLLTNAFDMPDIFCILRGMSHCWELVGSVNKVYNKNKESLIDKSQVDPHLSVSDSESRISFESTDNIELLAEGDTQPKISPVNEIAKSLEASKWFVMTLEEDFTEIQFYKRGFFVQYDSIVKAINVARMTGKTVRLSSKKCVDKSCDPKFGIYAIPNANEDCVFVGPYEMDEPMGIETVKTSSIVRKTKRTRGVWITTNKVDNLKVIDNPLSFILPTQYSEMIPLETDNDLPENSDLKNNTPSENDMKKSNDTIKRSITNPGENKIVKPIRIRRTNGFYHLASNGILQKLAKKSPVKNDSNVTRSLLLNATLSELSSLKTSLGNNYSVSKSTNDNSVIYEELVENSSMASLTPIIDKPVEIIPSEIKITAVYSTAIPGKKVSEKGMSILKPEEINKKLLVNKTFLEPQCIENNNHESSALTQDIENFIAASVVERSSQDVVYIISDEEEDEICEPESILADCKEVFIRCTNIEGIGWINGRRDKNGLLSFEFPGFKYSVYYNEKEALAKINQVLSRKLYVPNNINLKWEVVESSLLIDPHQKLKQENLGSDLILTKQGIRNKYDLTISGRSVLKTYTRKRHKDSDSVISVDASLASSINSEDENQMGAEFEENSTKLEHENHMLWNETVTNKSEILDCLTYATDKHRNEMTESLKIIMTMAENNVID